MGWLIFAGVVLAFFYVPAAYAAMIPNRLCDKCGRSKLGAKMNQKCDAYRCDGHYMKLDKSRSRRRNVGEVTVEFFRATLGSGAEWVLGLIGIFGLLLLWSFFR